MPTRRENPYPAVRRPRAWWSAALAVVVFAAAGVVSSLVACEERSGPMLHRLQTYVGELQITPDGEPPQSCEFSFHRTRPNMQVKITDGSRIVTVVRGAGEECSTFENARERAATAAEQARFSLIRDLCDPAAIERIEPGAETYRARRAGVWYTVKLEPQIGSPIHGHPR